MKNDKKTREERGKDEKVGKEKKQERKRNGCEKCSFQF